MQPLVSIVLCTYNGEAFLEKQILSLINQSYTNLEIIVSDDGSKDGTIDILKKYAHHSNIHLYLHKKNEGYIKNFEKALQFTSGELIAFSDQDDVWMPNKIELLVQNIGSSLLVYSDSLLVNDKGESLNKKLSDISLMYTGTSTKGFVLWNVVWGHTMMIKKELLNHCLPIPKAIPHDIWMAFKATTLGGIKYVDEVLTHYRQHANTVTTTTYQKTANKKSRTLQKRYEEFTKNLYWFKVMRDNERVEEQPFYDSLVKLYSKKQTGFAWGLFFFMAKHHKAFFMFRKKKLLSQLIEIRKQCRKESANIEA